MEKVYTDKEVLGDALCAVKAATNLYNMSANECAHDDLRCTIMDILEKEHQIQVDVFDTMHAKGFYPTPSAEATKIQEAKGKFAESFVSAV